MSSWLRLGLGLAALTCSLGAAPVVSAVDITVREYRGMRVVVVMDEPATAQNPRGGSIRRGDAERLAAVLSKAGQIEEVLFHSRGGSEQDGLQMGRIIRRAGLATRIPRGAACASACADAFLGGVVRRIEPGGRYGVHMPTLAGNDEQVLKIAKLIDDRVRTNRIALARQIIQELEQSGAEAASRWVKYTVEMGASIRLVEAGAKTPAGEMMWLTPQEMADFNVVNTVN